jgi:hemerythrin-like domain-containing protein
VARSPRKTTNASARPARAGKNRKPARKASRPAPRKPSRPAARKTSRPAGRKTSRPAAGKTSRPAARKKTAPSGGGARKQTAGALKTAARTVRGAVSGAVAAVSSIWPGDTGPTNAITLLEEDHRRMEDLLKQGEDTGEQATAKRATLLDTITRELDLHEMIEEKIFYPALQAHPEARDLVLEGYQEHHVADVLVRELHECAKDDERWGAKFKVLKENLEHHIDEEEGEMFRTARRIFSQEELNALGARMQQMKARN